MNFILMPLKNEDIYTFKKDMQEAFQHGAIQEFNNLDFEILPEKDIEKSLSAKGSAAYTALVDGKIVGGAIVVIDELTQHNHLDFLINFSKFILGLHLYPGKNEHLFCYFLSTNK